MPALPKGTSIFDWENLVNTSYNGTDGWATSVPANSGTPGARLYKASRPLSAAATVTTSSVAYVGVGIIDVGANGLNGAPGAQSFIATVYQWAATIPLGPSGAATLTWPASFGAAPTGYTLSPGTGPLGYTLWAASVRIIDTAGATTTPFNWSSASVMAIGYAGTNGAKGETGGTGGTGAEGASYVTAYCASSIGAGTSAPEPTTGRTSMPATGSGGLTGAVYSPNVPTLDASHPYQMQTDGIYNPGTNQISWSTPYQTALKVATLSAISANLGAIKAGSIDLGSGTTSWHVDSLGNMWAGSDSYASAPFRISNSGAMVARNLLLQDSLGNTVVGPTGLQPGFEAPGTLNSALLPSIATAATTANAAGLNAGINGNWLSNSGPNAATGFHVGPNSVNTALDLTYTLVDSIYSAGKDHTVHLHAAGTPTAGGQAELRHGDVDEFLPVVPLLRYEFGVNVSTFRVNALIAIAWFDQNKAFLSLSNNAQIGANSATNTFNPFPRQLTIGAAPSAARFAMPIVFMVANGGNEPYVFTSNWHFSEATPSQTVATPWVDGAPKSVRALGYSGDLNATVGAPAGTMVAGTLAQDVAFGATAAYQNSVDALAGLQSKLSKSGSDIMTGQVSLQSQYALIVGDINNGLWLGTQGIVLRQGGVTKVTLPISGDATFAGLLQAASGTLGSLHIAAGGGIHGGAFTSFAFPTSGSGFYAGPEGAMWGNFNSGKFVQINASGEFYSQYLRIDGSGATYSGNLNGVTGTFSGILTAAQVVTTDNIKDNALSSLDIVSGQGGNFACARTSLVEISVRQDPVYSDTDGDTNPHQGWVVERYTDQGAGFGYWSQINEGSGSSTIKMYLDASSTDYPLYRVLKRANTGDLTAYISKFAK